MKRLLSCILAIAMMLTMLPTVFAENESYSFTLGGGTVNAGEAVSIPVTLVTSDSADLLTKVQLVMVASSNLTDVSVEAGVAGENDLSVSDNTIKVSWNPEGTYDRTAVLCTIKATASEAGSASVTFTTKSCKVYVGTTKQTSVALADATITVSENTPAVDPNADVFEKNSTLVKKLDFDSGNFTKDAKVTTAIDGFTGYNVNDVYYTATTEKEAGNLNLNLHYDKTTGQQANTKASTWSVGETLDTPYIVVSYKTNSTNVTYNRVNIGFQYKNLNNGAIDASASVAATDSNGLPMIIKSNTISREGQSNSPYNNPENTGCDNSVNITDKQYINEWFTYTYVIDAVAKKAYLFIDDEYKLSLVIFRSRSFDNYSADLTTKYIAGVNNMQFSQDRSTAIIGGSIGKTYYDDIQIRSMTAAQAAALEKELIAIPEAIESGASIPTTTAFGNAITWTTSEANVAVAADGTVSIVDTSKGVKYEDVTFTASYGGTTATFTADVSVVVKYAEYIFGENADKAYNATSSNAEMEPSSGLYYFAHEYDGLWVKNPIIDLGEPVMHYVITDGTTAQFVDKAAYDAHTGSKQAFEYQYVNYGILTGDSTTNRYAKVGPANDQRDAIFGRNYLRPERRLGGHCTPSSVIHINLNNSVFTAADKELTVEVDMLDARNSTNKVYMQYVNTSGTVANAYSNETPNNDGTWKTFTFTLTDANFSKDSGTGLGDSKQDFRINTAGLPTYISAIRVYNVAKKQLSESDYTTITLADYDVVITKDGGVQAKEAITAAEAADAKLYVAFYNEAGNLVDVAVSNQVTDGAAQTIVTGVTAQKYVPAKHTIKTFLWDEDLKPYR